MIFATVSSGGRLYVKGPSGLDGDAMLLREWFGSSLADAFGLQTLNYSLMAEPVNPLDGHIPLADGSQLRTDMAFATRVEPGLAWEGGSEALLLVGNRSDFARMVVFDTWVRNVDRYCPRSDGSYHSNLGNVFLSTDKSRATKPQLLAVDHTHILFGNHEFPMGDQTSRISDPTIYGLFPEFRDLINDKDLKNAFRKLESIQYQTIISIAKTTPSCWGMTNAMAHALASFLVTRAKVVPTLSWNTAMKW